MLKMGKILKTCTVLFLVVFYSSQSFSAGTAKNLKCKGCVGTKDLAKNAVTSSRIKNGSVSVEDLSPDLQDAIGSTAEIATLEAAISSLQVRLDTVEELNAGLNGGDFTGRIYCFFNVGRELVGDSTEDGIYISHNNLKLTFTSSTQVSILELGDVDAMLDTGTGNISSGDTRPGGTLTINSYSLTGNILNISGTDIIDLFVSPDGNLLVGNQASIEGTDPNSVHNSNFRIAVRGDSC
jgi:hypothetical protein